MSDIKIQKFLNCPKVVHIRTGRVGYIIRSNEIPSFGIMYELAFEGQVYTECYGENEVILQ